jgi:hypothetical protein
MSQPIINNEVKKEEYTRPSEPPKSVSTDSPKPVESPKKSFFSYLNPFSNNETKDSCIEKCNKKYSKTSGGKKHRSKKNKNSKRKTKKSKSKKSKK